MSALKHHMISRFAESLGGALGDIRSGPGFGAHPGQEDGVQSGVGLPVPAAI